MGLATLRTNHAAFDKGLVSFDDDCQPLIGPNLPLLGQGCCFG
jgi:hypothetical protein